MTQHGQSKARIHKPSDVLCLLPFWEASQLTWEANILQSHGVFLGADWFIAGKKKSAAGFSSYLLPT